MRCRLLIVCDEEPQQAAILRAARRARFDVERDVVVVDTEEAALRRIAEEEFQLAIVDIQLTLPPPFLYEGLRVIERLAHLQPDCRIIALTTKKPGTEDGILAMDRGAHDFVSSRLSFVENWSELLAHRLVLWKGMIEKRPPSGAAMTHP